MVPEIGALLGAKYRVLAKLGEGGMGTVYRAENELTGKQVAIKWMHPHLAATPDAAERLLREARASSKLSHPNVVDVYDVVRDDQTLFLVMELLQGETLREYLRNNPNPKLSEFIGLLMGAMAGVAAAHEHGVIHRDLKPDNIFLERIPGIPIPTAKVVDFGIAKLAEIRGSTLTETGAAIGTPVYMSLEQLRGDKDIDARTDVYAFGVMLYEAVVGRMPYNAATLPELAIKAATTDAVKVRTLRPDVPLVLANIVDRAIARDRTQRWPDVHTLMHQLMPFVAETGFRAQPTHGVAPSTAWPAASTSQPLRAAERSWDATVALPGNTTPAVATRQPRHQTNYRSDSLTARELHQTRTQASRSPQLWIAAGAVFSVSGLAAYLLLSEPDKTDPSTTETSFGGVRDISKQITAPPPPALPTSPGIEVNLDSEKPVALTPTAAPPAVEPEPVAAPPEDPPKHAPEERPRNGRPRPYRPSRTNPDKALPSLQEERERPVSQQPPRERPEPEAGHKTKNAADVLGF
mgnify:FL=1